MNNPFLDILCPHCGEYVTPIYGNDCPNCGEYLSVNEEDEDYYDCSDDDYDYE